MMNMNWCGILLSLMNLQQVASFSSLRPGGAIVSFYTPLQSYTKPSVDEELQSSKLLLKDEQNNDSTILCRETSMFRKRGWKFHRSFKELQELLDFMLDIIC